MAKDHLEAVIALKELVVRHGLPKVAYALFGVKCPYCGKMDRIHRLDPPEALKQNKVIENMLAYTEHWQTVSRPNHSIGVCKFCHNLLSLNHHSNAEPLAE